MSIATKEKQEQEYEQWIVDETTPNKEHEREDLEVQKQSEVQVKENTVLKVPRKRERSVFEKGGIPARFAKADKKERFDEFVRVKFNMHAVTTLILINAVLLLPLGLLTWLANTFAFYDLAVFNYLPWSLVILLWMLPYATWHYSTITSPVMVGHDIKRDWSKKPKGRKLSAIFNLIPFHILTWAAASKYTTEEFVPYLSSIQVQDQYRNLLLTDNLNSLILLIYISPVIISGIAIFMQVRDYMVNKDLLETHFLTWEAPYISKFAHEYRLDTCDIIVGYEIDTGKPIVIKEVQRYLHEGIFGATGSGKTSTTLLLRAAQDLKNIATGRRKMGLVFLEPKGDAIDDILQLAKELGIPDEKIMVIDPTKEDRTIKYNPFAGHREVAAMSFQGTLNALTGDQDAFFKGQQNEAAQIYTLLAKIRYKNATNVTHIQNMFMDARFLADIVEEVRSSLITRQKATELSAHEAHEIASIDMILSYFENQVLDYKETRKGEVFEPVCYPPDHPRHANKQIVLNKKEQFITGAKKYLNEIALNSMLKSLFVSKEGDKIFDADEFLLNGGVLLVNTALPDLEELSLMFGQFFIRQFQSAIFRRPKDNRIPIYFYIDEFPLYVNEAFERILTLGRSYKVGALIAMQSIAQLEAAGKHLRDSILGNASHKTVFGRGPVSDNEYFSSQFGDKIFVEESLNESASPMTSEKQTWGYRLNTQKKEVPRFMPSEIHKLPFKEMIVQIVDEANSIDIAVKARGQFVNEAKFITNFLNTPKELELKTTKDEDFFTEMYIPQEKMNLFVSGATEEEKLLVNEKPIDFTDEYISNLKEDTNSFETSYPTREVDLLGADLIDKLEEERQSLEANLSSVVNANLEQQSEEIKMEHAPAAQPSPTLEPTVTIEDGLPIGNEIETSKTPESIEDVVYGEVNGPNESVEASEALNNILHATPSEETIKYTKEPKQVKNDTGIDFNVIQSVIENTINKQQGETTTQPQTDGQLPNPGEHNDGHLDGNKDLVKQNGDIVVSEQASKENIETGDDELRTKYTTQPLPVKSSNGPTVTASQATNAANNTVTSDTTVNSKKPAFQNDVKFVELEVVEDDC